jgi:hypothetical protein
MVIWKYVVVDSLLNDKLVDETDIQGIRQGRRGHRGRGGRGGRGGEKGRT